MKDWKDYNADLLEDDTLYQLKYASGDIQEKFGSLMKAPLIRRMKHQPVSFRRALEQPSAELIRKYS